MASGPPRLSSSFIVICWNCFSCHFAFNFSLEQMRRCSQHRDDIQTITATVIISIRSYAQALRT